MAPARRQGTRGYGLLGESFAPAQPVQRQAAEARLPFVS